MESETTTHMTAFSVVDSDLEYRLHHVARVKGLHTTYFCVRPIMQQRNPQQCGKYWLPNVGIESKLRQ